MSEPRLGELGLVALPPAVVDALVAGAGSADARVSALRTAGHSGGELLADAFERWATQRTSSESGDLSLDDFNARVGEFFGSAGWGALTVTSLHDVAAAVDIEDCWESRKHAARAPSCHMTTGALAAFFGRFAPAQLAAMEVECAARGDRRCRFLLGTPDVLEAVFHRMSAGEDYATAVSQLSADSASP